MAHRYFQNQFAGADVIEQVTQFELEEELDEDLVLCIVPFPVDQ